MRPETKKVTPEELTAARKRTGPIERRERRLAYAMLLPTVLAVLFVVLIPVAANFWVSVKPIELKDLRAAEVQLRERVRDEASAVGDVIRVQYQLRGTPPTEPIANATLRDTIPLGLEPEGLAPPCQIEGTEIFCDFGTLEPRQQHRIQFTYTATQAWLDAGAPDPGESDPIATGKGKNALTSFEFTFDNFRRVFDASEFWTVLWVSFVYTFGSTLGALIFGLFAAQLLMTAFRGRAILRGLFLFPYVSPVIAVAFTWIFLLDPFSGTVNAILQDTGVTSEAINFLGQRGLALWTVIAFEAWRYFPLAFLFILARMQSLSADLNEAAEMDGATPFQSFWYISLPQLIGIISTLFLLRFIWTFNKFDDIFLLTGGASGTRTLTVNVYEQAFALSNLGAGAAVAVVIFFILAGLVWLYFRFVPKEEGM